MADTNTHENRFGSPGIEPNAATAVPGLDAADLAAAEFAIIDYLRRHPAAPASLHRVRERLRREITAPSPRGRQCRCAPPESGVEVERTGTRQAAAIIGCSSRTVRRHAVELGGVHIGDPLWFDAALVRALRDRLTDEGGPLT